jgi:hypothetical protein
MDATASLSDEFSYTCIAIMSPDGQVTAKIIRTGWGRSRLEVNGQPEAEYTEIARAAGGSANFALSRERMRMQLTRRRCGRSSPPFDPLIANPKNGSWILNNQSRLVNLSRVLGRVD